MNTCDITVDQFSKHFNYNMKALGLPVPTTLFDKAAAAISNAGILVEALKTLGPRATVSELIGATVGMEKLKVAGALLASYYVGAVIGSIAVASTKTLTCGLSLNQLFEFQSKHGLTYPNSHQFYAANPEILGAKVNKSSTYWTKAIAGK
ncbi:hypothetical protein [Vibrio owensii]|uniref:hypothetical protein n=1 Tax=Vibrio owensii TaxID=696485 RepID=UPI0005ED8A9E|nr:hypothetical protein [Vibrio owensii]